MIDLRHGDALDVLRSLADESIDLHLWDPPYGLGRAPTPEEILRYLTGGALNVGDFMGADWPLPSVAVFREAFRTLRRGCYLLTFAGTRTLDLLAMGARMAGFVPRDTIDNEGDCNEPLVARWLRGQGPAFQKTTLRPLWEPLLVLWKPGALRNLNIDENRIGTGGRVNGPMSSLGVMHDDAWEPKAIESSAVSGRFPSNVTLSCVSPAADEPGERCETVGMRRVASHKDEGLKNTLARSWKNKSIAGINRVGYADPDGLETVPDTHHCDGCDVGELERQSGVSRSPSTYTRNADGFAKNTHTKTAGEPAGTESLNYGDTGTAARFYYSSKPSTSERDRGVESFYWRLVDSKVKASRVERITRAEWERLPPRERARGNIGPCVKRVSLCQHFASLYGVKGGRGFDAYAGTGSLLIAMERAGMQASGSERERDYVDIAEARAAAFADPNWKAGRNEPERAIKYGPRAVEPESAPAVPQLALAFGAAHA